MSPKSMVIAGVMSGTSADGINVALVRIGETPSAGPRSGSVAARARRGSFARSIKLLGHAEYPYPAQVRATVLKSMNAERASVADLARLNFLLGDLYADAVLATERRFRTKAQL